MPAPKGNQNAKGNKGGGRKTRYKKAFCEVAQRAARYGATDIEIAAIIGISEQTIYEWKKKHVEFALALKKGKESTDDQVENALLRRALGYDTTITKPMVVSDGRDEGSHIEYAQEEKHLAPDVTAGIFWLKNRRPEKWRDRREHKVEVKALTKERQQEISDMFHSVAKEEDLEEE